MKVLSLNETRKIKAGKGHYHWKCSVNGFISKVYRSWVEAAKGQNVIQTIIIHMRQRQQCSIVKIIANNLKH